MVKEPCGDIVGALSRYLDRGRTCVVEVMGSAPVSRNTRRVSPEFVRLNAGRPKSESPHESTPSTWAPRSSINFITLALLFQLAKGNGVQLPTPAALTSAPELTSSTTSATLPSMATKRTENRFIRSSTVTPLHVANARSCESVLEGGGHCVLPCKKPKSSLLIHVKAKKSIRSLIDAKRLDSQSPSRLRVSLSVELFGNSAVRWCCDLAQLQLFTGSG